MPEKIQNICSVLFPHRQSLKRKHFNLHVFLELRALEENRPLAAISLRKTGTGSFFERGPDCSCPSRRGVQRAARVFSSRVVDIKAKVAEKTLLPRRIL
jgi:hypothetical protein